MHAKFDQQEVTILLVPLPNQVLLIGSPKIGSGEGSTNGMVVNELPRFGMGWHPATVLIDRQLYASLFGCTDHGDRICIGVRKRLLDQDMLASGHGRFNNLPSTLGPNRDEDNINVWTRKELSVVRCTKRKIPFLGSGFRRLPDDIRTSRDPEAEALVLGYMGTVDDAASTYAPDS